MIHDETIYVLGCGAIGFPLAAYLTDAGRKVVAVRTSRDDLPMHTTEVIVHDGVNSLRTKVQAISFSKLRQLRGIFVITAKSFANPVIARALKEQSAQGPIVIMQNGVGVETAFIAQEFAPIIRCVLYFTSQATSKYEFQVRPIKPSPLGVVRGGKPGLSDCVDQLNTHGFPLRAEPNIQKEIWKKAISNTVFNSICPLLEVDNGVFVRDTGVANIARAIVEECTTLTDKLGIDLRIDEIMAQIFQISRGSEGQLISTFQDIIAGRETEIDALNLEIARIAAKVQPGLVLTRVEMLGRMILAKSKAKCGSRLTR